MSFYYFNYLKNFNCGKILIKKPRFENFTRNVAVTDGQTKNRHWGVPYGTLTHERQIWGIHYRDCYSKILFLFSLTEGLLIYYCITITSGYLMINLNY